MAYESWYTGLTVDKALVHNITLSGSAGVWTGTIGNGNADEGTNTSKFSYFDGLKVTFKMTLAGGSSSTSLNINDKGGKTVYYKYNSTSDKVNLTTQIPVGSMLEVVYNSDAQGWLVVGNTPAATNSAKTGITASSSTPSFTGSAHNHGVTQTAHSHGYDKVTSASQSAHGHKYTKATGGSFTGSAVTSGGPSSTTCTVNTASSTSGSSKESISTGTGSFINSVSYDSTNSCLTLNFGTAITSVTANGHTHSYTSVSSVTAPSHTHSVTAAGSVSISTESATTESATPAISLTYNSGTTAQTSTGTASANISINNATQGGSVSTPTITINDNGHTHNIK